MPFPFLCLLLSSHRETWSSAKFNPVRVAGNIFKMFNFYFLSLLYLHTFYYLLCHQWARLMALWVPERAQSGKKADYEEYDRGFWSYGWWCGEKQRLTLHSFLQCKMLAFYNETSEIKTQNEQKKAAYPCPGTRPQGFLAKGCLDAKILPGFTLESLLEQKSLESY